MNPIKIIHFGDLHFGANTQEDALKSLRFIYEYGKSNGVDLWACGGDMFDAAVQNTGAAGLAKLQHLIQAMMDVAPMVTVMGTITHDIPGCYDIFIEIKANHSFTILGPENNYYLSKNYRGCIVDECAEEATPPDARLLILGCGEPQKSWFLSDKRLSRSDTVTAINDGMRQILLGMGIRRQEHADLPCLFVGHFTVKGSSMCNGQVIPGNDIRIGRDDLALVGADYYALDHIHIAQQVPGLPAYYSGSCFPVNWGELDRKQFNAVSIPGSVEHIDLPHPPMKKIVTDWEDADLPLEEDVAGYRVWQVYKVEEMHKNEPDINALLEDMLSWGALPGSRVTVEIIPTETVRASEIQDVKALREKVSVWAKNSGKDIGDSILDKADELEAIATEEGLAPIILHIRWTKVLLRGATGIKKGLGKDEIEIDLEQYESGLITLAGDNGMGKTTIAEMLHPFTTVFTREGSLQSQFCLKDSYKDLYGIDDLTGDVYRCFAQFDPLLSTPTANYYLYKNGQSITNGRVDDYEKKCLQLFGTTDLYVRTAYVMQKPTQNQPELAQARRGQKREIFRELGGLDYLQTHADTSKTKADNYENEINVSTGKIEVLESTISVLPQRETELVGIETNMADTGTALEIALDRGETLKTETAELAKRVAKNTETKNEISGLEEREASVKYEAATIETDLASARMSILLREGAQKKIKKYEELDHEKECIEDKRRIYLELRAATSAEYQNQTKTYQDHVEKIQKKKDKANSTKATLETSKASLVTTISMLSEQVAKPITKTCPDCGQRQHKEDCPQIQKTIDDRERKLTDLNTDKKKLLDIDTELKEIGVYIKWLNYDWSKIDQPTPPQVAAFAGQDRLTAIMSELESTNITETRRTLSEAEKAGAVIEGNEKRMHDLNNQLTVITGQIYLLSQDVDDTIDGLHREKQDELENARTQYSTILAEQSGLQATKDGLIKTIAELKIKSGELKEIVRSITHARIEVSEWLLLKQACGPDGIQALELDAMGPGISIIANGLLQKAIDAGADTHFDQIRIPTTRTAGKGSKTKQVEDFRIECHDVRDDGWTDLSLISVGESVWIRKTIYDAFAAARAKTGTKFLTGILDESDGALDPEAVSAYFAMLQAAHDESGRYQTIVITHNKRAQDMIAQQIRMEEL